MLVRQLHLGVAELASLGSKMLSAGIEPIHLHVRGVGDQRDLTDIPCLGQFSPAFDRGLPACSRVSDRNSWLRDL